MKFEYESLDVNGNLVRGLIDAKNIDTAFSILLQMQLHPLDLRPLTESGKELNRLHNLKNKLTKTEHNNNNNNNNNNLNKSDGKRNTIKKQTSKSKILPIDTYHIVLILIIIGIMLHHHFILKQ